MAMISTRNGEVWDSASVGGGGGSSPVSVAALSQDAPANATQTGVEIAGLQASITSGTYVFKYVLRGRSTATATGLRFGINFTGSTTAFLATLRQTGTGTTAVSGTGDQLNTSAQIVEGYSTRSLATTSPNLGPTAGVDTANADVLYVIEGLLVVSTSGDLELWHASETAASTQIMAGSALVLTKAA